MARQVIVKDRKLKQLFAVMRRNRDVKARVGILGKDASTLHPSGDITLGELALVHEFGSEKAGVPQRSFIRSTVAENRAGIRLVMILYAEALVKGRDSSRARRILLDAAEKLRLAIIQKMDRGISGDPEGPPRTLEDTGALKAAIKVDIR